MINIIEQLLPVPSQRRSGQKIRGVSFIVAHDTGNDGSTAAQNVAYYIKSANEMQASAHFFVDDKQIICCVPENEKAWHVRYDVPKDNQLYGKDANDWALSVELCFSSKGLMENGKAYQNYIELHAYLCKKYNLNPATDIVAHATLDPTRRSDPLNAFKFIGRTWEQFIKDVSALMTPVVVPTPTQPLPPAATPADNGHIVDLVRAKMTEIDVLLGKIKV